MEGAWAVEKEEYVDANAGNKIQREMKRNKANKNSRPPGNQNHPPATGEPGPASPTLVGGS